MLLRCSILRFPQLQYDLSAAADKRCWLLGELAAIVAAVVVVVMAGTVATVVVVVVIVVAVVVVVVVAVFVPHSPLMSKAHPCLSQHSHTVKERCDFSSAGVILATAVISFLGPLRQ